MDCCNNLTPDFGGEPEAIDLSKAIGRRTALKRLASLAGGIMFISDRHAYGQGRQVLLAFCGQLLCVVPYEVARARGHFAEGEQHLAALAVSMSVRSEEHTSELQSPDHLV